MSMSSVPKLAVNLITGRPIDISSLGEGNTVQDLLSLISEHPTTPIGDIWLETDWKPIGKAQSSKLLKDFRWGSSNMISFKVEIDSEKMYENACSLVRELDKWLASFKPGFIRAAYGYPMFGKYDKNGRQPRPGVVVSLHESQADQIESEIRERYADFYAKHVPIYIDALDN